MRPTKKNKKIIAIIPARGGAKGIPKKNIRILAGKPLIVYTINSALQSKYVTRIVVSTDSKEVSDISISAGAEVIKRPKKFAKDFSPTQQAVDHVIDYLARNEKYKPDVVLLLQPTSPLRTAKDIDQALDIFFKNTCESVISICELEHSPHWSFKIKEKYLKPVFDSKYLNQRRQDLPKAYIPNGAIFISTPGNLFKYKSFFCERVLPYIMPKERSVDIDNKHDFKLAEFFIQESQNGKI